MGSIPIFSTGSGTRKCSFNGFYIMPAALLIFFVVSKCCLLPVAMAHTRKIVTKHNKKRKERKLCCLFIIFLLWDMQQVYRDLWVHPLNEERSQKGEYYTHYADHRLFDDRFFELYRMTVAQFDEILHKIRHLLQKKDTNFHSAISPEQELAITIR